LIQHATTKSRIATTTSITASPPSASFSLPCLEILREKIYKTSI
jgi:hypothetical protein